MNNTIEQPLKGAAVALAVASLVGCASDGIGSSVVSGVSEAASSATSTVGDVASSAADTAASAVTTEAGTAEAGTTDLAHCYGANICKGHNDCKTASNACAGQGACQGQGGFITAPTKACADLGGEVQDEWRGTVATADLVQCYGVNTCKGHNDCKTANNACAGQGECKGQGGFVNLTTKACGDVGGKVG